MSNEILTFEELNSAKMIWEEISREQSKLEALKISATSLNFAMDDVKVQSTAQTSKTEKFALLILEAERRIDELRLKLVDVSATLANKISATYADNPLISSVLIRHCCGGLTFAAIAQQLHFTVDYVRKIFKRAIATLSASTPA